MIYRRKLLIAVLSIVAIAMLGCEQQGTQDANTPAPSPDQNEQATQEQESQMQDQTAQAPEEQDLEQIRNEAQMMSESQLQSTTQQIASQYSSVQNQLQTLQQQAREGVGGMIAGDAGREQIDRLQQSADSLKERYNAYASVARQKGLDIPDIEQAAGQQGQQQAQEQAGPEEQPEQQSQPTEPESQEQMGTTDANMPAVDMNTPE